MFNKQTAALPMWSAPLRLVLREWRSIQDVLRWAGLCGKIKPVELIEYHGFERGRALSLLQSMLAVGLLEKDRRGASDPCQIAYRLTGKGRRTFRRRSRQTRCWAAVTKLLVALEAV